MEEKGRRARVEEVAKPAIKDAKEAINKYEKNPSNENFTKAAEESGIDPNEAKSTKEKVEKETNAIKNEKKDPKRALEEIGKEANKLAGEKPVRPLTWSQVLRRLIRPDRKSVV